MKKFALPSMIILLVMYIGFLPARAMDFTIDFGSISTLGDIGYGLAGGASFDFNNSKYKIDNYDVLSEHEKAQALNDAADQWLSDYAALRVPNMYMTTEYRKMVETANRNYWLANGDTAAERAALRLGINDTLFSSWAKYNKYWIKNYVASLTVEGESDPVPEPITPEQIYQDYIVNINGNGAYQFFWSNYPTVTTDYTGTYTFQGVHPYNYYSYFSSNVNNNIVNNANTTNMLCVAPNVLDIRIYSVAGTNDYTFSISPDCIDASYTVFRPGYGTNGYTYQMFFQNNFIYAPYYIGEAKPTPNFNYTGSLINVFSYISNHFRNVNIFVDGECWAYVTPTVIENPVIPEFNDVIITPNDEELAPDIVMPDTDYGGFDITAIFDAIKEAIASASSQDATNTGDGILDISDVISLDGIIDLTVGTAVDTIDVPFTDTIPRVIEDIDPPFPVFPLEVEPIHNAFQGTTILAELVDATQIVLPNELILVFWGIVFILFIIGLIKIFHK